MSQPKLEQVEMFGPEVGGSDPGNHPLDKWRIGREQALREHVQALRGCMRRRESVRVLELKIRHATSGQLVQLQSIRGSVATVLFRGLSYKVGVEQLRPE